MFFDARRARLSHHVCQLACFSETKRTRCVGISDGRCDVLIHHIGDDVTEWIELAFARQRRRELHRVDDRLGTIRDKRAGAIWIVKRSCIASWTDLFDIVSFFGSPDGYFDAFFAASNPLLRKRCLTIYEGLIEVLWLVDS
jgi:hypothetical protein